MAPKGKSSASAGTRKKHQRKAAGPQDPEPVLPKDKKPKGKDKKNKEPRKKIFIPYVKPAPARPDPLDTLGLASKLPPELFVVLRKLGKKDGVTKVRTLDELQAGWAQKALSGGENGEVAAASLLDAIPVWMHHFPALALHPSRRVRLLTVDLHTSLLRVPVLREQVFYFIRELATSDHAESILGAWCMAAHDADKQVASQGRKSWTDAVSLTSTPHKPTRLVLDEVLTLSLLAFIQRAALDPAGVYTYLNPPAPVAPAPPPKKGARGPPQAAITKDIDDPGSRMRDEDEEISEDRCARVRIGALGGLTWLLENYATHASELAPKALGDLWELLVNPALWTCLQSYKTSPLADLADLDAFGNGQPGVRRAGWSLLGCIVQRWKGRLESLSSTLAVPVLRSAWVEPDESVRSTMWTPLLTLIRDFPKVWEIEAKAHEKSLSGNLAEDGNQSDEDAEEVGEAPAQAGVESNTDLPTPTSSPAFKEFLRFLELGCSGSPLQGYPAVVLIVATIPPAILAPPPISPSPLTSLFESLWAALSGSALAGLDRPAASAAFISALLDCVLLLVRRSRSPEYHAALLALELTATDADSAVRAAVKGQFTRIGDEVLGNRMKIEASTSGKALARCLQGLYDFDAGLFYAAWEPLAVSIKAHAGVPSDGGSELALEILDALRDRFREKPVQEPQAGLDPGAAAFSLIKSIVENSLSRVDHLQFSASRPEVEEQLPTLSSLVHVLRMFSGIVFDNSDLVGRLQSFVERDALALLAVCPDLLMLYVTQSPSHDRVLEMWRQMLASIAVHQESIDTNLSVLVNAAQKGLFPAWLTAAGDLDESIATMIASALGQNAGARLGVVRGVLLHYRHFISSSCLVGLSESIVQTFSSDLHRTVSEDFVDYKKYKSVLQLVASILACKGVDQADRCLRLLPDVFILQHVLPQCTGSLDQDVAALCKEIWQACIRISSIEGRGRISATLGSQLRDIILDTTARPTPDNVLQAVNSDWRDLPVLSMINDILPTREVIDALLDRLPPDAMHACLAVNDRLVAPSSSFLDRPDRGHVSYDGQGMSSYARLVSAMLQVFAGDRQLAKENLWATRHFLALAMYCEERVQISFAPSSVFAVGADTEVLSKKAQDIAALLLSTMTNEIEHAGIVAAVIDPKKPVPHGASNVFVTEAVKHSLARDSMRESRILHMVMRHVLVSATKDDVDQWISLARKVEKNAPETALCLLLSITQFGPDTPRLERYRNELAADALGIPAKKANTAGLLLLRRIAAVAPDHALDIVFLPQTRAVNFMKACQTWITSDEDLEEDVESVMTEVFTSLAPILQNVPGAHWDLVFDLMENNLENVSFAVDETLITMARTLRLIITVQDLCATNKSLKALWHERRNPILTSIRNLTSLKLETPASGPRSTCFELAVSIMQDLPPALMDYTILPSMCHLVTDASLDVQKMAYEMLYEAAKKRTEHIVVEAGVDVDGTYKAELPSELVALVEIELDLTENSTQIAFGYLLGWMLTFDLFADASIKVRSGYIDHLKDLNIVHDRLLPTLYQVLGIYGGAKKAFKLDVWSVSEFFVDLFEIHNSPSLQLLAAHLYYRALLVVPSLVRGWLGDCRDVTLATAVTDYTSQHFSPVIINEVLQQVKTSVASSELMDDNLTVKVMKSVNEVSATYTIDEQPLHVALKLPSDWPLHMITITDRKNVGVPEGKWRAWILSVQQVMWSQNGTIVDGLTLFKKNVALHFEGMVECAICYSIIAVSDGSLPKKPCRTCRNRFHATCLFKWFESSHSSSCPLCRSEIL